jgi:hypothetical protein
VQQFHSDVERECFGGVITDSQELADTEKLAPSHGVTRLEMSKKR